MRAGTPTASMPSGIVIPGGTVQPAATSARRPTVAPTAVQLDKILAGMAAQTTGVLAANFLTGQIDREAGDLRHRAGGAGDPVLVRGHRRRSTCLVALTHPQADAAGKGSRRWSPDEDGTGLHGVAAIAEPVPARYTAGSFPGASPRPDLKAPY